MKKSFFFGVLMVLFVFSLTVAWADQSPTGQFSVQNSAPTITSFNLTTVETGQLNNASLPTNIGQTLNFTVGWNDLNGDSIRVLICKANDATPSGCGPGGAWTESPSMTTDNPESVYYTLTSAETAQQYNAYVFITDGENVTFYQAEVFYVNHRPYASNVQISPSTIYTNTTVSCTYNFNDPDGDSENVSGALFNWYIQNESTGAFSLVNSQHGSSLLYPFFDESDVIRCEVKVQDSHGFSDDDFVASGNYTVQNSAPTGASAATDASSACAKNVGETATFTVDYNDIDQADHEDEPVRIFVCRSSPCTPSSANIGGTCDGSQSTNDGSTISCTYTLQQSDPSSATWYVAACDDNDTCTEDSVTVYVNHAPSASGVFITPSLPLSNESLTCNYTFSDSDGGSDMSSFKWWVNQGSGWQLTAYVGQVLPPSQTSKGEQWLCSVVPRDQCSLEGDAVNSSSPVTIQNVQPSKPYNFMVRDGASSWDNTTVIDTHDQFADLNWTTYDYDGDIVTTYICITDVQSNLDSWTCNYSGTTTTNHVDDVTGLDYSGASHTYYVRLVPNDGSVNGTYLDAQFNLINSVPNTPSSLSPLSYHTQTPTFSWTATDPDDGSVDHWPADTVTSHIRVGDSCGASDYHSNDNANAGGETVAASIPWGTPGTKWANKSVCVRLWATDGHTDGRSGNYSQLTTLYDFLPDITNIELANSGATYSSCTTASCILNPVMGMNTTVAVRVTAVDTDNDCETAGKAYLHLCLVNGSAPCDESNNAEYVWQINHIERTGSTCTFTFAPNKSASDGTPEFFRLPNPAYKLYVNVTSQAGKRTSDPQASATWQYGALSAVNYPDLVQLGDSHIDLGVWNNGTSLAVMTNWGNTVLDLQWNSSNPTNGVDTWMLNGHDMQIDDDNIYNGGEATGIIAPVYLNGSLKTFEPGNGLQVCVSSACNDPTLNETLNTYFHIKPPVGLSKGVYNSTIYIVITQH